MRASRKSGLCCGDVTLDAWPQTARGAALRTEVVSLTAFAAVTTGVWKFLHHSTGYKWLLLGWGLLEVAFYAYQRWRYHHLNKLCRTVPDPERVAVVKERFLSLRNVICMKDFLSGCFHGLPFNELKRGNVEEFVAYGFYVKRLTECSPELRRDIRDFTHAADYDWDLRDKDRIADGKNPAAKFMAHLWEPLRVLHKPLAFHLGSESVGLCSHLWLYLQGFRHYHVKGMSYWVRRPTVAVSETVDDQASSSSSTASTTSDGSEASFLQNLALAAGAGPDTAGPSGFPEETPIMFLHGVGFGLAPYFAFLHQLVAAHGARRAIVLCEVRHVSLRLCQRAVSIDDVAHQVAAFLRGHGLCSACLVAHSYGTFVASRFVQLHKEMVQSMMLMDPVCMMTCAPQLLQNFVYKGPTTNALTPFEAVFNAARFLISRDLLIAEAFCRRFHWTELMLWPQDMPAASALLLSGRDDLVPAELVRKQVEAGSHGFPILYASHAVHGGFLLEPDLQRRIIAQIGKLLATRKEQQ